MEKDKTNKSINRLRLPMPPTYHAQMSPEEMDALDISLDMDCVLEWFKELTFENQLRVLKLLNKVASDKLLDTITDAEATAKESKAYLEQLHNLYIERNGKGIGD